jgi:hypothetical protein
MEQTENEKALKIGGWLLLPVLGLIISPVKIGAALINIYLSIFTNGAWQALTSPSSKVYQPLWASLIVFEVLENIIILGLVLTTLVFFFKKSKYTPKLIIGLYVLNLVFVSFDVFFARQIQIPMNANQEIVKGFLISIIPVAIWIPYFLVSKRVKATFIKDWPRNSFKPNQSRGAA